MGVGHLHAHQSASSCIPHGSRGIDAPDDPIPEQLPGGGDTQTADMENDAHHELDNPEMALEDREFEGWDDVESDDPNDGGNDSDQQASDNDDE